MKKPSRPHSSIILDEFINTVSAKKLNYKQTEAKMVISAKIKDAMDAKNIGKQELAVQLKRYPSVVTRWLSGAHNFTIETLVEIENALETKLINIQFVSVKDNLIVSKKMSAKQRKLLKLLDNDGSELIFSKGSGWWLEDEQIYSTLAKSLIQHCMVSLDQFSALGKFERYRINDTGRLSLRTGLLYVPADVYNSF